MPSDLTLIGHHSIGYSLHCPICDKEDSAYSCLHECWVCYECGELFDEEVTWEMNKGGQYVL